MKELRWRITVAVEPLIRRAAQRLIEAPVPNLKGDRDIEYSWIAAHLPEGPGKLLDFGTSAGYLGLMAVRKGFSVVCLDRSPVTCYFEHPRLSFVSGDIFEVDLREGEFDVVVNCSTIEHVGLAGRYGVTVERSDGDMAAMSLLRRATKSGGLMLLTVPVGLDRVFRPWHRVYGVKRLPLLLRGWLVEKEEYWVKNQANRWTQVDRQTALGWEPTSYCYGLGLFLLRKAPSELRT